MLKAKQGASCKGRRWAWYDSSGMGCHEDETLYDFNEDFNTRPRSRCGRSTAAPPSLQRHWQLAQLIRLPTLSIWCSWAERLAPSAASPNGWSSDDPPVWRPLDFFRLAWPGDRVNFASTISVASLLDPQGAPPT